MRWMEFGKCHLFFSCRIMKFLLFLLFLFLLFDNPQGSTISHKRSIRALNSSLLTNFNGTYARINPCTNTKIETTSYLASHEFRHHTQENDWNDYTHKFSSIITSFLRALGNLIHFSHKQSGVLNFQINTSISQKQDGHCETGKRTPCDTLPVITIEATDCEISPRLPCGNLPDGEQLSKNERKFGQERKESFCEDSSSESQTTAETFQVTSNFNKDSALNKPQCRTEDEIASVPFLDATADNEGSKLHEAENALILDDTFLLGTKLRTPSETEFPVASALMETEDSSRAINDSSENVLPTYQTEQRSSVALTSQIDQGNCNSSGKTNPETFADSVKLKTKSSKGFNEPNSSRPYYSPQTSHFGFETALQPSDISDVEESFYSNQPSHLLFREQRPNVYSKQLFDDNSNNQIPDSGPNVFLPNQEPDKSLIFPDKSTAAIFSHQELLPTVTQQPGNPILEMYPFSLQEQTQRAIKQNKELFQQSLQFGKRPDSFDKTQMPPNTNIFSETETTSYPSEAVESEQIPPNQIANAQFPQVSDLIPKARQFMSGDDQTPALEFSTSYPILSAQEPPIKNSQKFTLDDYDSDETAKEKDQAVVYPDELSKEQAAFESNSGALKSVVNFSPDITSSDKLSSFNIGNPLADPISKYSRTEKTFDEAKENQFLTNEPPVLISEPQQPVHSHLQENLDDSNTDFVTEADLPLPSDQYQSAVRPESQSLVNHLDQYDNVEEAKQKSENTSNTDPELSINKPSYSTRSFSPQYPADTNSDQKLTSFASAYESSSNFEPFPPSGDETFSDGYLTKLPPQQDSFENSQQILTTFDPYQDQPSFSKTPFPLAPEGKFALPFPNQLLNDDVTKSIPYDPSTVNSKQSSINVDTSRSPATASFDDYQDPSYSETKIEPSFTTPVQHFDDDNYDSTEKPYFTDDRETYSKPIIPTVFSTDELEEQTSSYSNQSPDDTLEQRLIYPEMLAQNYDTFKLQPGQILQKSLSKPVLDQRHSNLSTKQPEAENSMSYDSEIQPDLSVPQTEQYSNKNVLSEQNPAPTPYFDEDLSQENQTISSPRPLVQYGNEEFFPDKPSFVNIETTLSPDFSDPDDYFEPITAKGYQKPDSQAEFSTDFDARPENFSFDSSTTPLPPFSFQSEDFSFPSNYKTFSENPSAQTQVKESSTSLDEPPVVQSLPRQLEEPTPPISTPVRDISKFGLDFQAEKYLKQPSEPVATAGVTRQSNTPTYESQNVQVFSYADAPEAEFTEFIRPTSSEHQLTEKLAETEPYNYNASDLDNSESPFSADQQPGEVFDQESTIQNNSERFLNFHSKESSPDFSPSTELSLNQNNSDSPKEQTEFYLNSQQIQPSAYVSESRPLISTTDNDQLSPLELQSSVPQLQPESILTFPDDKILSAFSDQNPLDIPSQTDTPALMENQKLQSNDVQIPDSLVITPYTTYPQDTPKDSHSTASSADFYSTVSDESQLKNPNIHKEMKLTPNRKVKFNASESPQPELETYDQFFPFSSLQSANTKQTHDKKLVLDNDYSSSLPSSSRNEPPVYEYSNQAFDPYSGKNFAFESQPHQSQLSPPQTSLDEYSEITKTAETEKPFDADETTPSMLKISPSYINEETESQYTQENMPDYSSSLAAKPQQKPQPQPAFDHLKNVPGEEMAERTILLAPETKSFFEEPERFVANGPTPPFTKTHARDSESTDYNQDNEPKPKEPDYLNQTSNTNFNVTTPDLNNPTQDQKFSFTSPQSDSVPSIQSNSDVFTSLSQPSAFTFQQLNNTSSGSSHKDIAIPLRYSSKEHSGQETSVTTDKVSPQFRPTTAVNYDEEITEFFPTTKPQPQTSLDFVDQLSNDDIQEKLSDSSNQRYQVTSSAALSPELETDPLVSFPPPSIRKIIPNFDTSDNDALQSQTTQLDDMTDSLDRVQNNFDPNLSSRTPDFSSQVEPILESNHRQISVKYPENPSIDPTTYGRSSPNVSPREQKYFSEPFPQEQRLTSLNIDQQYSDPRKKFQARNPPQITQQRHQNTFDVPSINIKEYQTPATVSRHSETQKVEQQLYPMDSPNQYFNYNARALSYNPLNNFYNNKPESQTSSKASSEYSTSDDDQQSEGSLERPLPFNLAPYPRNPEFERSIDRTTENADSPTYSDYDQVLSSQLPNEELLEYDEDITQNLNGGNAEMVRPHEEQNSVAVEEEPRESSIVFQQEAESPLGFNQKTVPFDFQDGFSPNSEPPSFPSPPVQKEPHSNPLLETLESHLTSPFHEHLRPYASSSSFSSPGRESLNDSFSIDPQNQNESRGSSAISPYTEREDSELNFVNYQRSEPINGVETAQDIMNTPQPDSHAPVSELNIPSSKSGENCIECFGTNPTHPVYPFDPLILKGNMTAPSYYILVSKLPVDNDEEERFKVEKVYLGDGTPLNCTLSAGQTFPTSLYTPIPFSAAGTVKLRTKSDFA